MTESSEDETPVPTAGSSEDLADGPAKDMIKDLHNLLFLHLNLNLNLRRTNLKVLIM